MLAKIKCLHALPRYSVFKDTLKLKEGVYAHLVMQIRPFNLGKTSSPHNIITTCWQPNMVQNRKITLVLGAFGGLKRIFQV